MSIKSKIVGCIFITHMYKGGSGSHFLSESFLVACSPGFKKDSLKNVSQNAPLYMCVLMNIEPELFFGLLKESDVCINGIGEFFERRSRNVLWRGRR